MVNKTGQNSTTAKIKNRIHKIHTIRQSWDNQYGLLDLKQSINQSHNTVPSKATNLIAAIRCQHDKTEGREDNEEDMGHVVRFAWGAHVEHPCPVIQRDENQERETDSALGHVTDRQQGRVEGEWRLGAKADHGDVSIQQVAQASENLRHNKTGQNSTTAKIKNRIHKKRWKRNTENSLMHIPSFVCFIA